MLSDDLIKNRIGRELEKMGYNDDKSATNELKHMRSKDGIHLFRVKQDKVSRVLKYFEAPHQRKEIINYDMLHSLNIPTIKVIASTDCSLLLEDIVDSSLYRLGRSEDLSDIHVAILIAKWYKKLHNQGTHYLKNSTKSMYRETDLLTKDNLKLIMYNSDTVDNPLWSLLIHRIKDIQQRIKSFEETLTYNDFYWTNLIVRKDRTAALMFDYNLLGAGYRYADIRNVCSALSQECQKAFIQEYGDFDHKEKLLDNLVAPLITLYFAYQRPILPSWASEELHNIRTGKLYNALKELLQ